MYVTRNVLLCLILNICQMDTDSDDEPMFPYYPMDDFCTAFNYQDPLLTSPFLRAILSSNIECTKEMLQKGKNLNSPDNYGNTPLHAAVMQNNIEILNLLLQLPEIDLNCKNHAGDTPLLMSIKMNQPDTFIACLLAAGCNIIIANNMEETPLHVAVARPSTFIAHELIKMGAKINMEDGSGYTPLHHAVESNNLEAVCMLLYYSADVDIKCMNNLTPFMYAVNDRDKLDIARVLFDYYADFSCTAFDGYTPLFLAANSVNPIAVDIVKAGADVNWITPQGDSILLFALHYNNAELFKAVWPKFDHENLLHCNVPFLFAFINICCYTTSEWLECMYKILNSPLISILLEQCANYVRPYQRIGFFKSLIHAMYRKKIKLNDRLALIHLCLSFGAEVFISDINLVNELYGFGEELKVFINVGSQQKMLNKFDDCSFPLPTFILAQEECYSTEYVVKLFQNQFAQYCFELQADAAENDIVNAFGFFSLQYNKKQEIITSELLCTNIKKAVINKLKVVPEIPSLVELSRNQVRNYIKEIRIIKKPYHFHEVINCLNIPPLIKNILLFKEPLYK